MCIVYLIFHPFIYPIHLHTLLLYHPPTYHYPSTIHLPFELSVSHLPLYPSTHPPPQLSLSHPLPRIQLPTEMKGVWLFGSNVSSTERDESKVSQKARIFL